MFSKRISTHLLFLSFFAVVAVCLWGQQQSDQSEPEDYDQGGFKIGVEVNMVTVPVTVRRPEGGFVKGIPQKAFYLYEDGAPQEVTFFAQEGLPTRIALLLDISGSVRSEWGTIKYATRRFLENLHKEDVFSLITFNTEIRLKMDWGRQIDRVDPVLTSIYCKDNTKLWDAIWVVCNDVFQGVEEKKAVIMMSDGMDTDSSVTYKDALDSAVRSEAAFYIASKTEAVRQLMMYQSERNRYYSRIPLEAFVVADHALQRLARETGGRVLYPDSFGQLNNVYAEVYEELRNQYTIGYISTNTLKDGSYRRIQVKVDVPGATISARPGYYAGTRQ